MLLISHVNILMKNKSIEQLMILSSVGIIVFLLRPFLTAVVRLIFSFCDTGHFSRWAESSHIPPLIQKLSHLRQTGPYLVTSHRSHVMC